MVLQKRIFSKLKKKNNNNNNTFFWKRKKKTTTNLRIIPKNSNACYIRSNDVCM